MSQIHMSQIPVMYGTWDGNYRVRENLTERPKSWVVVG